MTQISVEKFLDFVQRSELIEEKRLPGMLDEITHLEQLTKDRFSNQKSIPAMDVNGLADYLVQKNWLKRLAQFLQPGCQPRFGWLLPTVFVKPLMLLQTLNEFSSFGPTLFKPLLDFGILNSVFNPVH